MSAFRIESLDDSRLLGVLVINRLNSVVDGYNGLRGMGLPLDMAPMRQARAEIRELIRVMDHILGEWERVHDDQCTSEECGPEEFRAKVAELRASHTDMLKRCDQHDSRTGEASPEDEEAWSRFVKMVDSDGNDSDSVFVGFYL